MAGEKVKLKIESKRQVFDGGIMTGMATARDLLEGAADLPGMGLARALIDAEVGKYRAAFAVDNLRIVAAAGHDITKVKTVHTVGLDEIEVEFFDLMDLADANRKDGV